MALISNFAPALVSFVNKDGTCSKKKYLYVFPLKNLADYFYYAETYYMDIGMNAPVHFEGFVKNLQMVSNVEYKFAVPNEYMGSISIVESLEEQMAAKQLGFQILENIKKSHLEASFYFWELSFGKLFNTEENKKRHVYEDINCGVCTKVRLQ